MKMIRWVIYVKRKTSKFAFHLSNWQRIETKRTKPKLSLKMFFTSKLNDVKTEKQLIALIIAHFQSFIYNYNDKVVV